MSLTDTQIEQASDLLVDAYRTQNRIERLPQVLAPQTVEDTYAIQDRVAAVLSRQRIHAWKTGAPDPATTPYAAPIFSQNVVPSPASLPADGLHMIGVEVELCYRLGRDLPFRERGYEADEVADAIDAVLVAIEVVDTRIGEWQSCGALWQLADNQINAALVLGTGLDSWHGLDPRALEAQLIVDGELKLQRRGSHPLGEPFRLLPWIANHLSTRCGGLRRGDLVTTGSWTGMEFVAPDSEVVARFPGVGEARVTFPR